MDVAKEIQELLAGLDDESAQIVAGMIVAEGYHADLGDYPIAKSFIDYALAQHEELSKALARNIVAKRAADSTVEAFVANTQIAEILKSQSLMDPAGSHGNDAWKHEARNSRGRWTAGAHGGAGKVGKPANKKLQGFDDVAAMAARGSKSEARESARGLADAGVRNPFTPEVANFERLQHGARLLHVVASPYLPGTANVALATAGYAGEYGAEAQKVFGPTIDRTKMRYTGTERKLDQDLVRAYRRDLGTPKSRQGITRMDSTDRREKLIHGHVGSSKRPGEEPGRWYPSDTIAYFKGRVPRQGLAALQRFSGHVPPSEGIIIDAQGKIAAQMVGSGDDHYLPFDLNNLKHLKGGEYIRTRTNGGPTTEDLYTGLMAGARSMTVVSNNGVYNIELDDALRGSRRYSQTAREMTDRYGKLLDAVKNGNLRRDWTQLDPDRLDELKEESLGDPTILNRLREQQASDPKPSKAKLNEWTQEFLADQAQGFEHKGSTDMYGGTKAGHYTTEELYAEMVRRRAKELADEQNAMVGGHYYEPDDSEMIAAAQNEFDADPTAMVRALGKEPAYRRFINAKEKEYESALAPVRLNGEGYNLALHALNEQYPYFIKRVKWYPETENRNAVDEGYVKPRFVRPAAAKAGYYDRTILGTGKVNADRIRYQNYGVMRRLGEDEGSFEAHNRFGRAQGNSGDTGVVGSAEGPKKPDGDGGEKKKVINLAGEAISPEKAKRSADLALIKDMRSQTHWGPDATVAPDAANAVIEPWKNWAADHPTFKYLTYDDAKLDSLSDDELDVMAKQLMKEQETNKAFRLDRNIVENWRRGGGAPKTEKWPVGREGEAQAFTHNPREDHLFDFGEEFKPGREPRLYAQTYSSHPEVKGAVANGDLGSIADPEMLEKANAYIESLQQKYADGKLDEREIAGAHRQIRGAAMAKQLARLWAEKRGMVVNGKVESSAANLGHQLKARFSPGTGMQAHYGEAPSTQGFLRQTFSDN